MFAYFRAPVGWLEILKRTVRETLDDGCFGLAAQLAFYFVLGLFPALIFLIALIGFIPVGPALEGLLEGLSQFAPTEVVAIVNKQLTDVAAGRDGGLLTLGILGAIWSSSAAMTAIISALNRAYDVEEWRSWWKRRLLAVLLTLGLATFLILSLGLIMMGPVTVRVLAEWLGAGERLVTAWGVLQWPLSIALVVLAVDLVYYFAPNADTEWVWITPGSLIATALWLGSSLGFKFYVGNIGSFGATYGTIGGMIVLLLWLYVTGLSILIGAEMNAVIDAALPYHDSAEPSAPGQRKKIGPAAERAHLSRGNNS